MKITKEALKQLILEELGGQFWGQTGPLSNVHGVAKSNMAYGHTGKPPDNSNRMSYEGRPEYETLGMEVKAEEGVDYVTVGNEDYKIFFERKDDFLKGHVEPVGKYVFAIKDNNLEWEGEVPPHVRYSTHLSEGIVKLSKDKWNDSEE